MTSKQSNNANTPPKCKVVPEDGWNVQTKYGTLKNRSGAELVRLEDVHSWLCAAGNPAQDAVYKIFSPFYEACITAVESGNPDDLALPGKLNILNVRTWPDGLLFGADRNKAPSVGVLTSAFPALGHIRLEDGSIGGLIYSIAEGARRVWHGIADISTDRLAAWESEKNGALDVQYGIKWPSDEVLRTALGRIAVPIETANELWQWGSVCVVIPLHVVSEDSQGPENWTQLVAFRKANPEARWSVRTKSILKAEFDRRDALPAAKGTAVAMAEELGYRAVTRFNKLKATATEPGTAEKKRGNGK